MFDIPGEKIFMDSIHGYISVPKCFVRHLIDTEAFQRLRNIDQTGMKILYPNAKHDRFSHSLGVFHLGCRAVDTLLENFSYEDYWNIRSDKTKVIFWAKNKLLFLIACLLHDIGHAPFSHSLEQLILQNSADSEKFSERLISKLSEKEDWGEGIEDMRLKAAPHEQIGTLFIMEFLAGNIECIYDELIALKYPSVRTDDILYAEHYSNTVIIDKSELWRDICFIVRMILGLKYKGYEPEKQIRNCFIELLNGSDFDVDKLDYVVRDTEMSGISNTGVDVDRLLGAVSIVTKTRYIDKAYHKEKLIDQIFLHLVSAEGNFFHICGRFRGTILLKSGAKVIIKAGSKVLSLTPVNHAMITYTDRAEMVEFSEETTLIRNGELIQSRWSKDQKVKILTDDNGRPLDCSVRDGVVRNDFCFTVVGSGIGKAMELQINDSCDLTIDGAFRIKSSVSCFEVELDGNVKEAVLLNNFIFNEVPSENVYNEFSVGFKKKAINVIANVLEARDYLYLWIYAHHKVMYYANFLIPTLSRKVLMDTELKNFLLWRLNYKDIIYLDDSYVWTAIKHYYYNVADNHDPWGLLCKELLQRRYKFSLYKSLAEYDLLFESFSRNKKMAIKRYLFSHCRTDFPYVGEAEGILAGYLNEELLRKLKAYGGLDGITSIVYVDASYKSKKINADETFVVMKDKIVSLNEIPLLAERVAKSEDTSHYFYLYCSTHTENVEEGEKEMGFLKSAVRNFFEDHFRKISENPS